MKKLFSHRLSTLFFLVLLFAAPGIAALYFYNHPELILSATTNKGSFVDTQEKLPAFNQQKHWKLLLWAGSQCGTDCQTQLDKLARLRLALGRRLYEVDALLLLDYASVAVDKQFSENLKTVDIHLENLPAEEQSLRKFLGKPPSVFIVSPEGDFVLSYRQDAKSEDIYKDLKHLLMHSSEKRG